ncbi:hypothetical protein MMYC01_204521 [Madurella mycetomatis]|uniref:Aminoglycoside phosphotransferase domain-containing protein n=1 Tax=Madurella mycetomatis TaxID=100816 RepID=A0A175W4A3_9PEZI|nr:hypothetical protein MMYC01_204521 [Madurella mycetomatis]
MEFNFQAYLSLLYPSTTYHISPLTGGLVNFTVRARRANAGSSSPSLPNSPQTSLILKYAPPYIAAVGASAPFPQARQTVEATVLKLFYNPTSEHHQQNEAPLAFLANGSNPQADGAVSIPRLIVHDTTSNVLILEDLGDDLITLWDLFKNPNPNPDPTATSPSAPAHPLRDRCANMGFRLGLFFRNLHSAATLTRILTAVSDRDRATLESTLTREVVRDAAVRPILPRLQQWAGLGDDGTARRLYARVEADFERGDGGAYGGEACLSMGDLHPGSVLVRRQPDARGEVVAVIDWEFATLQNGRGANGDMAQFLANMHVLMLSLPPGAVVREAVEAFVREMCRAYAERWGGDVIVPRKGLCAREKSALGILRSALILFGRETINQAVERRWEGGGCQSRE